LSDADESGLTRLFNYVKVFDPEQSLISDRRIGITVQAPLTLSLLGAEQRL